MSKAKSLDESQHITPVPVEAGEVHDGVSKDIQHDAVFGDITEDGPNYRNVNPSVCSGLLFLLISSRLDGWELLS
jgi:hypothetical protein